MNKFQSKKLMIFGLALVLIFAFTGISVAKDVTLRITWWAWNPSELLEELSVDFTKETGIKVIGDWVPFGQLHDKVMIAMAAKDPSLDMIIADSQWMGELVEGGHVLELTDWIKRSDTSPAFNNYYRNILSSIGEYPIGSGHQYGLPVIQDGIHIVYQKALFENPKEKAAFKAKYGRELAVPKTWFELRDVAEFFTRPKKNLYGLATYYSQSGDTVSTAWNEVLWSWGGELWNPKTKEVDGYVNSPVAVDALKFYVGLKKFCPPGAENYGFEEVLTSAQQGLTAMSLMWFAFDPGVIDPNASRIANNVGFAVIPAGPKGHYVSLGGQGITINKYGENKAACYKYIDWLFRNKTCEKYARMGAATSNKTVLDSPAFVKIKPWFKVTLQSIPLMKDFWNVTCYSEMLDDEQKLLNAAAVGSMTPKAALDELAKRNTASLKKAGYLK